MPSRRTMSELLSTPTRIMLSGGGTGGHVYPAIAIADALKAKLPMLDCLFVGAIGKMEMEKVPQSGYPIQGLWIDGFHRKQILRNVLLPLKLVVSFIKAYYIIHRFKPFVVVGTGGYASAPVLKLAKCLQIDTVIVEPNSYPGITNRLLAKGVDKICVAYPNMDKYFPKDKLILTGNPIRNDVKATTKLYHTNAKAAAQKHFGLQANKPTIVAIGGSLGAKGINDALTAILPDLQAAGYQLLWQSGKIYYQQVNELAQQFKGTVIAIDYINRMDLAYIVADIIVSRAGAGALAELSQVGKPVILMPSPNVADDHQTKNAQAFVDNNAAILIKDKEANNKLFTAMQNLISDTSTAQNLQKNIQQFATPNAANAIADEIIDLLLLKND